ncbi:hypothetical protein CERZMDRAFT_88105 [Cercospora zeae-maydis SCOH1-5]|uniref:Protein kinase domain-containing protein n=1 Tax=Cercospora zeae-maydis SCOH1-5 TaxID=717836 RepID=A0A6A6F3I5_9PEZI|nr:hypothetical protein CERZMDRAFT_88105 [Cercospora zeae-maydis SCOH1-5]
MSASPQGHRGSGEVRCIVYGVVAAGGGDHERSEGWVLGVELMAERRGRRWRWREARHGTARLLTEPRGCSQPGTMHTVDTPPSCPRRKSARTCRTAAVKEQPPMMLLPTMTIPDPRLARLTPVNTIAQTAFRGATHYLDSPECPLSMSQRLARFIVRTEDADHESPPGNYVLHLSEGTVGGGGIWTFGSDPKAVDLLLAAPDTGRKYGIFTKHGQFFQDQFAATLMLRNLSTSGEIYQGLKPIGAAGCLLLPGNSLNLGLGLYGLEFTNLPTATILEHFNNGRSACLEFPSLLSLTPSSQVQVVQDRIVHLAPDFDHVAALSEFLAQTSPVAEITLILEPAANYTLQDLLNGNASFNPSLSIHDIRRVTLHDSGSRTYDRGRSGQGSSCGNRLSYLAPEIMALKRREPALENPVTPQSDVFALGICLALWLRRLSRPPWAAVSDGGVTPSSLTDLRVQLQYIRTQPELSAICKGSDEKQNMQEFIDTVLTMINHDPKYRILATEIVERLDRQQFSPSPCSNHFQSLLTAELIPRSFSSDRIELAQMTASVAP